jgi:very-short-patch-repair endonuclease
MAKIPQALSVGEETMALHLRANNLSFEREALLIPTRMWRVDFMLRQFRLVVEVEGGTRGNSRHTQHAGFESDCSKYNAITLAGYSVLRYSTEMVERGDAIRDILSACAHFTGKSSS